MAPELSNVLDVVTKEIVLKTRPKPGRLSLLLTQRFNRLTHTFF